MRREKDYEQERENAVWRMSISRMFQSEDLEGLIDLRDGPDLLDDEIIEFLNNCIKKLTDKELEK